MANIKELRGRIRSVRNIAQITKAMEMVASMKLRKVQARALSTRPYALEIYALARHLADFVGSDAELPLFRRREVKTTGVLVVTSDRGLCGAYNANVIGRLHRYIDASRGEGRAVKLYVIGRKGYAYFYRRGFAIERFFAEPPLDKMTFEETRLVSGALVDAFLEGAVDEVRLFGTAFLSAAKFEVRELDLLPIPRTELQQGEDPFHKYDYLLEPSPEVLLNALLPAYVETIVAAGLLQSLAAEHAARRMAMKGATDAATRMGRSLRRIYNRARQESITKELLDIVGGATAVQG